MINDTRIEVVKPFRVEFYGLSKHIKPNIFLVNFIWRNNNPDWLADDGFKDFVTKIDFDTLLDLYTNGSGFDFKINFAYWDEDEDSFIPLDSMMQKVMMGELVYSYNKQEQLDEHEKNSELKWYDEMEMPIKVITQKLEELNHIVE